MFDIIINFLYTKVKTLCGGTMWNSQLRSNYFWKEDYNSTFRSVCSDRLQKNAGRWEMLLLKDRAKTGCWRISVLKCTGGTGILGLGGRGVCAELNQLTSAERGRVVRFGGPWCGSALQWLTSTKSPLRPCAWCSFSLVGRVRPVSPM